MTPRAHPYSTSGTLAGTYPTSVPLVGMQEA
jgi:hypothetical protein